VDGRQSTALMMDGEGPVEDTVCSPKV
jgi:hypothetical protein